MNKGLSAKAGGCGRKSLLRAVLLSSALLGAGTVATLPATAAAQTASQPFDIRPQGLPSALTAFSTASGWEVGVAAEVARDVTSPGVSGTMPAEEALRRLLSGTGVTYRMSGARSAVLVRAPSGSLMLDPVTVEGTGERATGPVMGYVARQSAMATKTDTPLIETPQSVSVVTRDQMDAQAVRNLADALNYTSGVMTARNGDASSFGGDGIQVRGFGGDGTTGVSFNEYLDGLRLKGSGYVTSGLDPYLFERVEVLKGPASVLFGQTSPGGLVNMVTKQPSPNARHELVLQAGSDDRYQGAIDIGGDVTPDKRLSYRFAGVLLDSDGQTDFTERRRVAAAPTLTFRPTDDTELTLIALYQNDDFSGSPLNFLPSQGTLTANPNGKLPISFFAGDPNFNSWDRTTASIGYRFQHRFDDTWTVRQNARYLHNDLNYRGLYAGALLADMRTLRRNTFSLDERSWDVTVDNQLQASFDTGPVKHTALFGVDIQRLRSDTLRGLAAAPNLDIFAPVYGLAIPNPPIYQSIATSLSQTGVYLQDQLKLDRLVLVLGGRKDWAESKQRNRLTGATSSQQDDAFTGRVGALYLFDNGVAPYASYSESFEPVTGTSYSGSAFEPTSGQQYEVGVKVQPTGMNSLFTLSAFHLTQQNVTTTDPDHAGFSVQTGEVRSRGIEAEARVSLAEGLNLVAAYTWLDAEVTESNDGNKGNTPVAVPSHTASAWVDHTVQAGPLTGVGGGIGVRYVGSTWGDTANTLKVPSHTLVDAALRYDLSQLNPNLQGVQLAINANNLFDKEYVSACTRATSCYYGQGRTVIGSLRYSW
ncbi:TonB-dependent siderophore receptor [Azospirillum sp. RWY-5-1]|uniref:TonB-dependent siderophore receptor n=1 Tax=Azospirillum oleiclasticum TaxID=2735135 RepID=A0ABX2T776_9PROT|nr:TonB-dependent siderophore receptor [Azospirillum oleiclasticum]NYZ13152.1 TonB-dependent siderophore receptor [Azospirillum oleiclasticum]NYZ20175.1 TonB-dependent siderophore receptor [Azospirillum oleiclasticum]